MGTRAATRPFPAKKKATPKTDAAAHVSPDDIHVYSIDEVFIDATSYLKLYKLIAREFAMKMIRDVLQTTGITATAGIGPNMYLCKIAMDIEAKHIQADKDGVRISLPISKRWRSRKLPKILNLPKNADFRMPC